MGKLGIVPAAGRGSRWGGTYKELLPIGTGRWLVDEAVDQLRHVGVRRVCVVTSSEKIAVHAQHFAKPQYCDLEVFFVVQRAALDLWGAILESLPYTDDVNYMVMPDTAFHGQLPQSLDAPLMLGVFETNTPERFGAVLGDCIQDKNLALAGTTQRAWGAVAWSREVGERWFRDRTGSFPAALSEVMGDGAYALFPIQDYADMAMWNDYVRFRRTEESI